MFKTYYTRKSAKLALKKSGLEQMTVDFEEGHVGSQPYVRPVILCELMEDVEECARRGFKAKLVEAVGEDA